MNALSLRATALLSAVALGLTLFTTASAVGPAPAQAATTAEKDPNDKNAQEVGYDCDHARLWSFPRVKPGVSPVCKVLRVYDEQTFGGPVKVMGEVLKNCSDVPGAQGYSRSETVAQSFSIGLNPALGLGKAINLSFGWETSTAQTTEISSTAYMPGMGVGWITSTRRRCCAAATRSRPPTTTPPATATRRSRSTARSPGRRSRRTSRPAGSRAPAR
ncbi:hypothetical protein OG401_30535 [Kitasatospora purpeofusca]|uniref:hypothetical protein n=1 Tax=Kitasatospora purpeofusca TaxID=67352 RepID=UPI00225792AE|nr:hypothetical protein [Kitasatospora purpeofusca]MCX4688584.1 hypothetical protein [Kitasatospora purpeofusca]